MIARPDHGEPAAPLLSIEAVIDRHGAWRVLRAAAAALLRGQPRPRRLDPQALPNALRRDLGLPPVDDPPRHWTIRW